MKSKVDFILYVKDYAGKHDVDCETALGLDSPIYCAYAMGYAVRNIVLVCRLRNWESALTRKVKRARVPASAAWYNVGWRQSWTT